MRDTVRAVLGDNAAAGESLAIGMVFACLFETRKDLDRRLAQHFLALHTRDALHRAIPGGVAEFAIKRDDAVNVCFEEAFKEEVFLRFVGHLGLFLHWRYFITP